MNKVFILSLYSHNDYEVSELLEACSDEELANKRAKEIQEKLNSEYYVVVNEFDLDKKVNEEDIEFYYK